MGEPSLFEEPVLVASLFPRGKVVGCEVFALVAEALDDVGVGEAIEHPVGDGVADGWGVWRLCRCRGRRREWEV